MSVQDVIGNKFTVQSPKQSAEYLVQQINEFLIQYREKFQKITDEDFENSLNAVIIRNEEKDLSLRGETSTIQSELSTHKYTFDRQKQSLSTLRSITKKEIQDHFKRVFFSG